MSRDPKDPFVAGERLGPYEVVRCLGKGTFGVVYEVLKGELRKRRALKVLLEKWSTDAAVVARFRREARAIAALQHKNIVEVHELGVVGEHHVIEMEFLTGELLGQLLKRAGGVSVEDALDILLPVVSAMEAAHALKIVHRDIKPENIFLAREADGNVVPKVLDFGVARMVEETGEEMTATGQQIGTPSYMSPEQVQGDKSVDGRADQWALAVLLYVMLTGRKPFHVPHNVFQTHFLIMSRPPPPMRDAGVEVPEALELVIRKALQKSRDARYASTRDFGVALVGFARPETRSRFEALWGVTNDFEHAPPTIESPAALVVPASPLETASTIAVVTPTPSVRAPKVTETLDVPPLPPVGVHEDNVATDLRPSALVASVEGRELASDAGVERTHNEESSLPPSRRRTWTLAALISVLVGFAAFGAWWAWPSKRDAPVTVLVERPSPPPATTPEAPAAPDEAPPAFQVITPPVAAPQVAAPQIAAPPAVAHTTPSRPIAPAAGTTPPRTVAPRPVVAPVVSPRPAESAVHVVAPSPATPAAPAETAAPPTAPSISVTNHDGIVRIRRVPAGSSP